MLKKFLKARKKKHSEEVKQESELDSDMTQIVELSDRELK